MWGHVRSCDLWIEVTSTISWKCPEVMLIYCLEMEPTQTQPLAMMNAILLLICSSFKVILHHVRTFSSHWPHWIDVIVSFNILCWFSASVYCLRLPSRSRLCTSSLSEWMLLRLRSTPLEKPLREEVTLHHHHHYHYPSSTITVSQYAIIGALTLYS